MSHQIKRLQAGFSLVEIAIIIMIGGILLGSFMTMLLDYIQEAKLSTTHSRMAAIDNALGQYLVNNGSYPCPASLTAVIDTPAYGVQVTTAPAANDCYGDTAPAAGTFRIKATFAPPTFPAAQSPPTIRIGAVPVRSLNLPDQYMNDGWNDRFYYAVTEILASPGNVSATPLYNPNDGAISIVDSNGNNVALPAGTAQYVVISSGQDRVGAYTADGVLAMACNAATPEALNCLNAASPILGTFRSSLLTSESAANAFDDFVIFHTTSAQGVVPSGTVVPYYTPGVACAAGWIPLSPAQLLQLSLPPPIAGPPNFIYCLKQ